MFVYSPEFTHQSHLAPVCYSDLDTLCQRDYGKSYFSTPIFCLDLDTFENLSTGNNDATMDAATGMADWQNNHSANNRHLLIELRFGYKSTEHFDFVNMKRKVSHSRDLLNPERVNEQVVFLYERHVAPQAMNRFSRLSSQDRELKQWLAMDVEGFNSFIVDRSSLPYDPENNLEEIKLDLKRKYEGGGLNALECLVKYWRDKMDQYNLRYKQAESNAIAQVIIGFLKSLSFEKGSFEEEYLELCIDDIKRFIQ